MAERRRASAALLAVLLFSALLFSVCFIAAEAEHDCSGEGCFICFQLAVCETVLKVTAAAVTVCVLAAIALRIRSSVSASLGVNKEIISLVSLKVKLSD